MDDAQVKQKLNPNDKMETEQQNLFGFQLKVQTRVAHTAAAEVAVRVASNVFIS